MTEDEARGLWRLLDERDRRYIDAMVAQRVFFTSKIEDLEKAIQIALAAADKASSKSDVAFDKRFELINEFRGTLADQNTTFMTKAAAEQRFSGLDKTVSELAKQVDRNTGRDSGIGLGWKVFLGVFAVLGTLLGLAALLRSMNGMLH